MANSCDFRMLYKFLLLTISSCLLFSKREDNTTDLRLIFIHVIANLWRLFEVTANNSQEAMNVYLATDKLCGLGCHEADFQRRCICGILQMNLMNELKRCVWISWVEFTSVCQRSKRITHEPLTSNLILFGIENRVTFENPDKDKLIWIESSQSYCESKWILNR